MWGAHTVQCVSMAEGEVGQGSRRGPGLPVGSHVSLLRTHRGVQKLDAGARKDSEGPFRGRKRNECQLHAVGEGGREEVARMSPGFLPRASRCVMVPVTEMGAFGRRAVWMGRERDDASCGYVEF